MLRIAINGFGRIGKNFFYALFDDHAALDNVELVAINGYNQEPEVILHNLKYDTLLGRYQKKVYLEGNNLILEGRKIKLLMERTPEECRWGDLGIDWVVDCSGCYTRRELAMQHIEAGAQKVLISAPAEGEDVTIVPGVNEHAYKTEYTIVSLGSCTTNAVVPLLHVLHNSYSVVKGFMTTIHAYTNSQTLHDSVCSMKKLRKHRAGALNIIPTTTGAAKAIARVLPALEGKIDAMALRVPVGLVSLLDVTVLVEKPTTIEEVHEEFSKAMMNMPMPEIIDVSYEELVSSDYIHNGFSVVIDAELTKVQGNMCRIYGWYDNEWAYSKRMKDFLLYVARS